MKPLTAKQQYWADHLQKADDFDGSVADYARHAGLPAKALYQWRGILRQKTRPAAVPVFTEVVSAPPTEAQTLAPRLTLQLGAAQLQFDDLPDEAWLARLITAHG